MNDEKDTYLNDNEEDFNENIKKRIRKLIEEVVIVYENEFNDKFDNYSNDPKMNLVKNKGKISKIGIQDSLIENFIKSEVEDIIGIYLLQKNSQNN